MLHPFSADFFFKYSDTSHNEFNPFHDQARYANHSLGESKITTEFY